MRKPSDRPLFNVELQEQWDTIERLAKLLHEQAQRKAQRKAEREKAGR